MTDGIHSPFNACMFRDECRSNAGALDKSVAKRLAVQHGLDEIYREEGRASLQAAAAHGTGEDFLGALGFVQSLRDAPTNGRALGLLLSYRRDVRLSALGGCAAVDTAAVRVLRSILTDSNVSHLAVRINNALEFIDAYLVDD